MNHDCGQEHVFCFGADIAAENVFGHGDRRQELISRLAQRGDLREFRGQQMRNPDGRRGFEPHAVAPQIEMCGLGGMQRGHSGQDLARQFDAVLGGNVRSLACREVAQPLQASAAVVHFPKADTPVGIGRLRDENPVLAIFVPIAQIVEDFPFTPGNFGAPFLGLKSFVRTIREVPEPQGAETLRCVLLFRLIFSVNVGGMLKGGAV
jgi:hypothetical protein